MDELKELKYRSQSTSLGPDPATAPHGDGMRSPPPVAGSGPINVDWGLEIAGPTGEVDVDELVEELEEEDCNTDPGLVSMVLDLLVQAKGLDLPKQKVDDLAYKIASCMDSLGFCPGIESSPCMEAAMSIAMMFFSDKIFAMLEGGNAEK